MVKAAGVAVEEPDRTRTNDDALLLRPVEAGQRIGVSDDHIYRLVAAGALPVVDVAQPGAKRTKIRIHVDDLREYVEAQRRAAPRR